ncbi:hypothetical protein UFOVP747_15 [uncultured Caudovirales phage]|uniref:Uncharacterized protein n=1 Tax=uncultured Caudovirales phage TaxID=2100421 RepID=A0A6J7XC49_9CAUD|nr:hypothetical protein UFOVP675_15 [uncultured Caudovirales phage]CAB5225341.1 hypothetical protein UFOVP747_15 [uncultured Caudovirales phage]
MPISDPIVTPAGTMAAVTTMAARRRTALAVFTLASDAAGTYPLPFVIPAGARVLEIRLNTSVTLGASATLAVGVTGTVGKYRAAATFTTADQWVSLALNAVTGVPLTAPEQIILTTAVAALPASGRLLIEVQYVID